MSDTRNLFEDLSDELVLKIFSFLDLPSLVRLQSVCNEFKRLASDNYLFYSIFKQSKPNELYKADWPYKTYLFLLDQLEKRTPKKESLGEYRVVGDTFDLNHNRSNIMHCRR